MCTRFTSLRVNVTGSSHDVGFEAAGQFRGLVPDGTPQTGRPSVGYWRAADIEAQAADLPAAGATHDPQFSVFALGVEAL
jgi:hypothetical protein